ncbi:unnamed protein product [Musa hybrid cultivar]
MDGDGSGRPTRRLLLLILSISLQLIPGLILPDSRKSFNCSLLRVHVDMESFIFAIILEHISFVGTLFFFLGLSENPSPSKDSTKADSHYNFISNTGLKVLLVCLGVATLVLLSLFLFKMWQKKKREEQHARLLKLFEEDDELEVELGLRDREIFLEQ